MRSADQVVQALRRRGELWEPAPGMIGLRGSAHALYCAIEREITALAGEYSTDEWRLPPALPFHTLQRADYFSSFPQWLTVASHLTHEPAPLEALATAVDRPDADARAAVHAAAEAPHVALQPALCYHVYAALAGRSLAAPVCVTCQGTCWRHERERHAPLARGWSFTMRELVYVGPPVGVAAFRAQQLERACALAERLGLEARVEPAVDPFFAPSGRGRALLQRVKGLKDELLLPVGGGAHVAAASFNDHERFFGDRFDIRADDEPAASGCVAFGIERWLLAYLVAHGVDACAWPDFITVEAP